MARTKKDNDGDIHIVTSGSNIRFEPVKSSRQSKSSKGIVVSVAQEISPVGGFLDFLREHAVVGLIIGFVLGTQVQSLVKQLIQSFLDPLTKLLFGTALSARTFTLHFHGRSASFQWGAMVYALIIFLFVLITLYLAVRALKLESFEKQPDKKS